MVIFTDIGNNKIVLTEAFRFLHDGVQAVKVGSITDGLRGII